jgi:DNA-binding HxlR family transcriptional regulator
VTTSTAGQRREAERAAYNANLAECPGHDLLGTLSDKWVTLVISALADGPLRHAELARVVAGASQKMLTQTLRKLERDGLVERCVTAAVPVRVDYALTHLGRGLLPVQRAIKAWAEEHIEQVHAARDRYDAQDIGATGDA